MRKLLLLIAGLLMAVTVCRAQDDQPAAFGPGWYISLEPGETNPGVLSYPDTPNTSTYPGGTVAIAEAITPQITALAGNLENDPTLIYNYVHDQIQYTHYFGSHKGATLTLLERSGNDFDQCSLLVALLRAAGYSPSYQFGVIQIPYSATNQQDYQHWVGATMPNTNWAATSELFMNLNDNAGFPFANIPGSNQLSFHHVWVQLTLNGTTYNLDPSFKVYQPQSGLNLDSAANINTNTILSDVESGATLNSAYVQNLNEGNLRSDLATCAANLLNGIQTNNPNATVQLVTGAPSLVTTAGQPLPQQTAFAVANPNEQWPVSTWNYIPTGLMAVYSVSIPIVVSGLASTYTASFYTPQLSGQKLSLVCDSNGAGNLYLEDNLLASFQIFGIDWTFYPTIAIQHPYGNGNSWNFNPQGLVRSSAWDQSVSTQPYQLTNATYVFLYGFDPNQAWLSARQDQLDDYIQQGLANSSRQVMSETLNTMGLGWMAQANSIHQLVAGQTSVLLRYHHCLGRMAQETGNGYFVDFYAIVLEGSSEDSTNQVPPVLQAMNVGAFFGSAMEHGIIEEMQNSNIVGASTVKMLEVANATGEPIYLADSNNWSAGVKPYLSDYDVDALGSLVSQGYSLLLPGSGSIAVNGPGTWTGQAFLASQFLDGQATISMIIEPGGYGGFSDTSSPPDPGAVSMIGDNSSTAFNNQSATLPVSAQLGADPVNLADGSFQISSSDLTLGRIEPRGLNLTRYYSSARRYSNPAGMGPGWLHSYYCTAVPESDWQASFGGTTPQQMAPMLVAVRAALDIYNGSQPSAANWLTTALIAKWGIDQVISNAVSVNLGNQTVEFVRQPNGSFTPPANCTMTLLQTNGAYWLQERHGRTFEFGANTLLTNIVDQYGRSMKLRYNSVNLLTNVTDWTNRSLTFAYTSGQLTSVSDSMGRSVSYGYTGSNLTSHTDPESKTCSYAYDTNNDVVATYDALGNLVVTNNYDGFGHITTQLTLGHTNELWQVFASGPQTIEINPASNQLVYTYDSQSRPVEFQDALGNITQTIYDGQDHVVETISPLGEASQYFYDTNHNLIGTVDPLGYTTSNIFDANNNLITAIDQNGHASHFGYNSHFSLTGATNGNGDWSVLAYNTDGTLASRQDSAGTTTYTYDNYGNVKTITYPNSLGSEAFLNSAAGDVLSHTNGNGLVTTYAYNSRRQLTNAVAPTNLTAKATFDANGNLSTTTDARGNLTSNSWSTTRKLLRTTLPTAPQGTPVIVNTYDNRDWLASTENPLGKTAYYTNDAARRLVATTDPLQRTTAISYDSDSHQTNLTDAAGDQTKQFWDARGNPFKVIDAAANTVGKAYDGAGNLICLTNRNNHVWTFQYDGANRLTNTISPLSHSSSAIYNNRGLVQSSTDPMNQTTTYDYDARGRVTSRTDNVGTNLYQYDHDNNLIQVTSVGGAFVSWSYNAYDRPIAFTNADGYAVQYAYDQNGNLTNILYPGDLAVNYYYDSNNRVTNVTDWGGRQTVIGYDLAGHVTSVTRPNNTIRSMSYDADGELTNIIEQTTSHFPICFCTLNYNNAGRVQWEFKGPLPHSYAPPGRTNTYDADNRLATFDGSSVTVDADGHLTYDPGTNSTFVTNSYDARNELAGAGGIHYGYDPLGVRRSLTNGSNFELFVTDPKTSQTFMRLQNADELNTVFAEWEFDGSSFALIEVDPLLSTNYIVGTGWTFALSGFNGPLSGFNGDWDSWGSFAALDNNYEVAFPYTYSGASQDFYQVGTMVSPPSGTNQVEVSYYVSAPGIGLLYEVDQAPMSTNVYYYHFDSRGSTVALTDGSGNITDQFEYSPYGTQTYHAGTNNTPFQFNGQFGVQTDPNGLLYMRARYYNPYLCRFLNPDPSGFNGGLNFYAFCDDNPISLTDPFGLDAQGNGGFGSWISSKASSFFNSLFTGETPNALQITQAGIDNAAQSLYPTADRPFGTDPNGSASSWSQVMTVGGSLAMGSGGLGALEDGEATVAADSGLIGLTSGESSALARQIYGIEVNGQPAVSAVDAFGSRAGSTFRGLGGPSATSDLDIRITLTDPSHFGAVNAEMNEIGALFQSAKGFPLEPTYVIPGLPPPTLL